MRCCFLCSLGSRKTPKHFTELMKAISLAANLKDSVDSAFYILVKTIVLVFNQYTVRALVSHTVLSSGH
jgi:hypothetical protein